MKPSASRTVWREYLDAFLVAALFLSFTHTFLLKTFYIPSGSMEDTLLVGDHLVVNRFVFGVGSKFLGGLIPQRMPERGDVLVFRSPEDPEIDLIKRCVGLPGDRLQMIEKDLFVNGQASSEKSFAVHRDPLVGLLPLGRDSALGFRDNFGPFIVPDGEYFFLGDNRDHSKDSRYWGTVPLALIKGRAVVVYWSYDGDYSNPPEGFMEILAELSETAIGLLSKSRWSRSFHVVR